MTNEDRESVHRLTRDLVQASATLSEQEVRFLVDAYYISQDSRKRSYNQVRAMNQEPHGLTAWLAQQSETLENQIKRALQSYAESNPVGRWMMSNYGVGPVIAAGMLAHIDIDQAPTAGHIWEFAGLDPTTKWLPKTKRPWNAKLKTLCWKVGQSFMKFSNQEECVYGKVYQARKATYVERNDSGAYEETSREILRTKNYNKSTEAYKAYSVGRLPPAHVDARARRATVKLFLSHLQLVWWFVKHGELPPAPYAIAVKGHSHFIAVPNVDEVPGLREALAAKGWQ